VNLSHASWSNPLLPNQPATSSTVQFLGSTLAMELRRSKVLISNNDCVLTGTVALGFWAESMGDVVGRVTRDDAVACCWIGVAVGVGLNRGAGTFPDVICGGRGSVGSSMDDGVAFRFFFFFAIKTKTTLAIHVRWQINCDLSVY
jgi:hypothetical protein